MDRSSAPVSTPLGAQLERLQEMLVLLEQSLTALDTVSSGALENPWRVVAAAARTRDVLLASDAASGALGAAELRALSRGLADTLARAQ